MAAGFIKFATDKELPNGTSVFGCTGHISHTIIAAAVTAGSHTGML